MTRGYLPRGALAACLLFAVPSEIPFAAEIIVVPLPSPGEEEELPIQELEAPVKSGRFAILRGLDKVTGRAETFEVPVGGTGDFGRLSVSAKACEGRAPNEMPESAAFLQIRDTRLPIDERLVFSGWMFASSPGLSAMDHARYDVWVLSCSIS